MKLKYRCFGAIRKLTELVINDDNSYIMSQESNILDFLWRYTLLQMKYLYFKKNKSSIYPPDLKYQIIRNIRVRGHIK